MSPSTLFPRPPAASVRTVTALPLLSLALHTMHCCSTVLPNNLHLCAYWKRMALLALHPCHVRTISWHGQDFSHNSPLRQGPLFLAHLHSLTRWPGWQPVPIQPSRSSFSTQLSTSPQLTLTHSRLCELGQQIIHAAQLPLSIDCSVHDYAVITCPCED